MAASCPKTSSPFHGSWNKHLLQDNSSSLLYSLSSGKPNTKIPLVPGESDLRPRVDQSPPKGPTCFYYALNLLRDRIGANPPKEYERKREMEAFISSYRYQIEQLNRPYQNPEIAVDSVFKLIKFDKDLHSVKLSFPMIIQAIHDAIPLLMSEYKDALPDLPARAASIIQEFCAQTEYGNLDDYIKNIKHSKFIAIHQKFFQVLGIDPKKRYDNLQKENAKAHIDSSTIHLSEAENRFLLEECLKCTPAWDILIQKNPAILGIYFQIAVAEAYGFKEAEWRTSQTISSLFQTLKNHGPLYVGGLFGNSYYAKEPTIRQIIEGRSIYGWAPEDRLPATEAGHLFGEQVSAGHAIVIIGAAKGGSKGGYVYFIDPSDGSSATDPSQQKIYVISYENFVANVSTTDGRKSDSRFPLPSDRYAWYFPR
ncbi:MAG: hypothetical protein JSR57_01505 [Verrucomicrobia bacterium]|nr:hypothetical protein [Verrucomicrobiota bacterium]